MKHISLEGKPRRLNVGCGQRFHPEWINMDLDSCSPQVIAYDLRQGLPFDTGSLDCVYHSHVLEHLTLQQGTVFLTECFRVLKPNGILRIVVPNLEQIARLYLASHQLALAGDSAAVANYAWMKLELLDQMVRTQSGGMMGPYMADAKMSNREFVISRIGDEIGNCSSSPSPQDRVSPGRRWKQTWQENTLRLRKWLADGVIKVLLGKEQRQVFRESCFRNQGEIHRWMYDEFSLTSLCSTCGFEDAQVCSAFESHIENFASSELDHIGDRVRKPDSLFMEFRKPADRVSTRAA